MDNTARRSTLLAALGIAAALIISGLVYIVFVASAKSKATPAPEPTGVPRATVAPIPLAAGLDQVDLCRAIPSATMEAIMGRKLTSSPAHFDYYNTPGASGCWYDVGHDALNAAHFGYVVLTPFAAYQAQPLVESVPVTGLGQSAYFNTGANARQLWVKIDDSTALLVGFGDQPNEPGALAVARLVLAAIQ